MNWKRTIGWALAGLLALLLIAVVCGYFYLRSNSFQQFALRKIVEQVDQATGGRTQIGGLDFNLSTLTAHLYNITMRGTEGPDQPPLLHADELTVRIKILSALHHQVALRELLIAHPVIHFQVSREGKNNLPTAPPSQSSSHTSVLILRSNMSDSQTAKSTTTTARLLWTPICMISELTYASRRLPKRTRALFPTTMGT
jgi:uncharacterized protein involved in outer membrane biogenesis